MFKGFYTLTSSMLTENRRLGVTSNNLANISTPGYKSDSFYTTNFGDTMTAMTASNQTKGLMDLENSGTIVLPGGAVTNFAQGNIEDTGSPLDCALLGDGFFEVLGPDGPVYTKNGSFSLDQDGFMYLQGTGRVMGVDGPIQLTDSFEINSDGSIVDENGELINQLRIVDFETQDNFVKVGEGLFQTNDPVIDAEGIEVRWKSIENSNVDPAKEMTAMMESQRVIQGASQILKIYDQLTAKAATEIGRV